MALFEYAVLLNKPFFFFVCGHISYRPAFCAFFRVQRAIDLKASPKVYREGVALG